MATAAGQTKDGLSFGPFNLIASERLLTKDGAPVELGARAFEILIALISTPNEVISKKDLMSRVWPDVTVEEGSLRFHMTSLRKALGDGKDGARYITTLAGRGYCFVAPVSQASRPRDEAPAAPANFPYANLPHRLGRMVGRSDDVHKLSAQLRASRLVTIVGPGGVGKTTVAVAVAHHLADAFAGSVLFVDLGMLSDPKLATTAISSMMGLSVQSDDATPGLIAFLKGKRILLILDTCEHLVDAIAGLAASLMEAAPQVHILATSREALRIGGEHIYRLDALACPPDDAELTAEAVRQFPATQLFLERAAASGAHLDISEVDAPIVANICRKLDGVPLAIELAARRVEFYGIQQTAALLDQHLTLLWHGSRTAPPRQKTLQATLNWSYELLSELERVLLRRLSIFVGHFTLDAALEVVASAPLDRTSAAGALDSLVEKSMVAVRPIGAMVRYRLLDTTRAYALETNIDGADLADLAVRHATYFRHWLEQTGNEWETLSTGTERAPYFAGLNNVRAALEWCFGENGNVSIGVELAAAAAPVFVTMSLLPECHRWSERALLALDDGSRGGREEMQLQAGFGISLMHMHGEGHAARAALNRSLAIADERGDIINQVRLLGPLHMFNVRGGDFKAALDFAKRCIAVAGTTGDPEALALGHTLMGNSFHLLGNVEEARAELEAALQYWSGSEKTPRIHLGFGYHNWAESTLARTLWFLGYPEQALARARQAIEAAKCTEHTLTLSHVLNSAVTVFLWAGDLPGAKQYIDFFISHGKSYALGPALAVAHGLEGVLDVSLGNAREGVTSLQDSLKKLHAVRYERRTPMFNLALGQGLAAIGRLADGIALIDETIRLVEANGDVLYKPELLRAKGRLLLESPQSRVDEAEKCFMQSLELSRAQGSRAWELRTAIELAALWAGQGRVKDARGLLLPVFKQFTEGLNTPDLKAAQHLLTTLG